MEQQNPHTLPGYMVLLPQGYKYLQAAYFFFPILKNDPTCAHVLFVSRNVLFAATFVHSQQRPQTDAVRLANAREETSPGPSELPPRLSLLFALLFDCPS